MLALRMPLMALGLLLTLSCKDGGSAPQAASNTATTNDATAPTTAATTSAGESGTAASFVGLRFEELEAEGDWGMVTDFRFIPGTDEIIALEKSGRVGHLRLEGDRFVSLGSFQIEDVYSVLDCGLISLALDPDFSNNQLLYIGLCVSQQSSEIRRYTFDSRDYPSIPASQAVVLSAGDARAPRPWHNVGSIGFDPDGTMWALFGDKKVAANGQDASTPLSSLIRLIPDRTATGDGYTVPSGNAFADESQGHPLVYALGLRSPWKGLRDREGRYWFGDVGANTVEEINIVTQAGQNFGWPTAEGPCEEDCEGLVDPVTFWEHQGVHRYSVEDDEVVPTNARVGYVALQVEGSTDGPYRGALDGHVLFGDYCLGYVRGATLDDDGALREDRHLGHLHVPSAWGQGTDGYIYAATFGRCETPSIDEDDPPASRFVRAVPVFEAP